MRGLRADPEDLLAESESFIEEVDGDVTSFLPSALEKLHFFDGDLWVLVGVVDLSE